MSASREKKQRQSAGPDQKVLKAQQEQAARKRTIIIYSVIAAVIAVLVVALLVWRSGFFQARATAVTVGDETLTAAELSYYYYGSQARQDAALYAQYGMGTFDISKADEDQFYNEAEGQTYRDYFLDEAVKTAQQEKALAEEAVKMGHTEDEVKDSVKSYVDNMKAQASSRGVGYGAYLRQVFGPYMSSAAYEKLLTRALMASLASGDKGNELYDGYTQADLDAYYSEHKDELDTVEYSSLFFPVATVSDKDADGNTLSEDEVNKLKEEAQADAKKKAEEALKAVEGGATFQAQIDKYELTGTTNTDHNKVTGTGSVNSAFSEQLFALDKDKCDLVETDTGYYVISFHGRYLLDEPTADVRHILARAESTTDDSGKVVAPTDEAWAAAKAKMDEIQAAWDASGKTEDDFANLANEKSEDGDGTTGGLYERIYEGRFVPEFNDWLFGESHKHGDTTVIQHMGNVDSTNPSGEYWGYHLAFYVGENEPVWMNTVRSTLGKQDLQDWIDGLASNFPATLASGANYLGK